MPDATATIEDLPLTGSFSNTAVEATQGGSAVKLPLSITTIRAESWIIRRDLTSPPANPAEGDRYLVASSATGDWMGLDGRIVQWVLNGSGSGNWYNKLPAGILYVLNEDAIIYYNGTAWVDISSLFSADFDAAGAAAAVLATSVQKSQNLADLSDKPLALANLGGAASGANTDISSLDGLNKPIRPLFRTITAAGPQTLSQDDDTVYVNQTVGAPITLHLPASPTKNCRIKVKDVKRDAGVNYITVDTTDGTTVEGDTSALIVKNGGALIFEFRVGDTNWSTFNA